jgi:anthranilate/para-aminobenzoate synthase component I
LDVYNGKRTAFLSTGTNPQWLYAIATTTWVEITVYANRSRPAYQTDIADCHEQIRLGESYELCLTNQLETTVPSSQDPFQLYKILRQHNPITVRCLL